MGHNRCVVLYACGMFMEQYSNSEDYMKKMSSMLNVAYTRRNSHAQASPSNFFMLGFPISVVEKYTDILLDNDIAVGIVEQCDKYKNGKMHREMTQVHTPDTNISKYDERSDKHHITMFIEPSFTKRCGLRIYVGVSKIDLSTGVNQIHEDAFDSYENLNQAINQLSASAAKLKVMVHGQEHDEAHAKIPDLQEITFTMNDAYFELCLSKVYGGSSISLLQKMNLSRCPLATKALIMNLNSILTINKDLLNGLNEPVYAMTDSRVLVNPSLLSDIHVLKESQTLTKADDLFGVIQSKTRGAVTSLLEIYDQAMTNGGSRGIRQKLLNPTYDPDELNQSYTATEEMQESSLFEGVREVLNSVKDPTRNLRRLQVHSTKVNILNLRNVVDSLRVAKSLVGLCENTKSFVLNGNVDAVLKLLEDSIYYENVGNDCLVKRGVSSALDDCVDRMQENKLVVDRIQEVFSELIGADNSFRLESVGKQDDKSFKFTCTSKRSEILKANKKSVQITDKVSLTPSELKYTLSTSRKDSTVSSGELEKTLDDYRTLQNEFARLQQVALNEFTAKLLDLHLSDLKEVNAFITECDVYGSLAMVATKNAYYRPEIYGEELKENGPMFEDLRHPIIENNHGSYVANDVDYVDKKPKLCFSENMSGKSCLGRSLVCGLYLSQCGLYPPCRLRFSPFKKIFTRLSSDDNLVHGLSSYSREILDLKYIISHLDASSFLFADEVANSTESSALLCLNYAMIETVWKKNAVLYLTTHAHSLKDIPELKARCKYYYMDVVYGDAIVYNYKFLEGAGERRYGLLTAGCLMGQTCDFIKLCNEFERKYINHEDPESLAPNKRSRYNAGHIIEKCEVCGITSAQSVLEVHHLVAQVNFDENKLNGHTRKDCLDNIVTLCNLHHDMAENPDKLQINGWVNTSNGRVLDYDLNSSI